MDGLAQAAWFKIFSGAGPLMIHLYNLAEPARQRIALNRLLAAAHQAETNLFGSQGSKRLTLDLELSSQKQ